MSVTLSQLRQLLLELGFHSTELPNGWSAHQHARTLVLLPTTDGSELARPTELVTTRKLLVENGYLSNEEFNHRVAVHLTPSVGR